MIAAALSIQDPRERPPDKQQAGRREARPLRRRDLGLPRLLNLWDLRRGSSSGRWARARSAGCARQEFLNYLRDPRVAGPPRPAPPGRPHARAAHETPHPDDVSTATRSTSRCWPGCSRTSACATPTSASTSAPAARASPSCPARRCSRSRRAGSWPPSSSRPTGSGAGSVARVAARVGRALAGHLVVRTYGEPHWDRKQAAVIAYERVTLYGLPLVDPARRRLRADRPRGLARPVPAPRARRGRLGHPPRVLRGQPPPARRRRGARAPRPPPRPRRRRPGALRLLRRPHPGRRRVRPALRRLVEEGAARRRPTC